jgi:hypothetical protein
MAGRLRHPDCQPQGRNRLAGESGRLFREGDTVTDLVIAVEGRECEIDLCGWAQPGVECTDPAIAYGWTDEQ